MNASRINEFNEASVRKIAKEVVIQRYSLILHCWIYAFVNLLLFAINWVVKAPYPWYLWAITGWGLLLGTHIFYYYLYKRGIVALATLGILYNIWAFVAINLFLFFIDAFTGEPMWSPRGWFVFPLGSWGFLLIVHFVIYYYIVPKRGEMEGKTWLERKVDEELEKVQQARQTEFPQQSTTQQEKTDRNAP